jgi:hypothetical protein
VVVDKKWHWQRRPGASQGRIFKIASPCRKHPAFAQILEHQSRCRCRYWLCRLRLRRCCDTRYTPRSYGWLPSCLGRSQASSNVSTSLRSRTSLLCSESNIFQYHRDYTFDTHLLGGEYRCRLVRIGIPSIEAFLNARCERPSATPPLAIPIEALLLGSISILSGDLERRKCLGWQVRGRSLEDAGLDPCHQV